MIDPIEQFRAAMRAADLMPPAVIQANGKLHRFATNGSKTDDSGWYVLYGGSIPAGCFGDWRTSFSKTWRADIGRTLTPDEQGQHQARVKAMLRAREVKHAQCRAEAQSRAATIWRKSTSAPNDHPYLTRKHITANGARLHEDALLIPLLVDGELQSLQFIKGDGNKRFLNGGQVKGCHFSIGTRKDATAQCIAEGFATGAGIHEATGYPVTVAFNASNLETVARILRNQLPNLPIIVCADDDSAKEDNPGLTKATEAARAVGGLLAVPSFGDKRPDKATDFNDMVSLCGKEAVATAIAHATPVARDEYPSSTENPYERKYSRNVQLVRASDIKPEPISWLWPGWLAAGKMHILGGAPGTGKTTISLAMAAVISTGGFWPDRTPSPVANVVIWSGEDDPKDTLVPRLQLAEADMSRVFFVHNVKDGNKDISFDPARDMALLQRKLAEVGDVSLLIIDSIVSAIAGDSHRNAEVRRGLQPLVDLAASTRCVLLGITHFSKGTSGIDPVERITGSLAFGAVARVVMVSAKCQESEEDGGTKRILVRAKSNIGPDGGGFDYRLEEAVLNGDSEISAAQIVWGEALEGSARELIALADASEAEGEGGALGEAKRYLNDLLTFGSVPVATVREDSHNAGHSWATILRAKTALNVTASKQGGPRDGGKQRWVWALPVTDDSYGKHLQPAQDPPLKEPNKSEEAQQNMLSTFNETEHLQHEDGEIVEVEV